MISKPAVFIGFLFLLGTFWQKASAQPPDITKLNEQLNVYEVQFKQLMNERGLPYFAGKVDYHKLKIALDRYAETQTEQSASLGFLFYHFKSDTLHTWLLAHKKLWHEYQYMTVDSILTLTNTLKFGLSIDHMLGLSNRTGTSEIRKTKKYRMRSPEVLARVNAVLFPESIAQGLNGVNHLLIIPALNISTIPISLLKPWGNESGMLIDSLSYSFVHNFTQLFEEVEFKNYSSRHRESLGKIRSPLIVGNPTFDDPCTKGLKQLQGAEAEINYAAKAFQAKPLVGAAARKDSIIAQIEEADLIYWATHGWSDTEDPLQKSFIAFYQPDGCGYLNPLEIQELELKRNPLVILSACQSGLGKVHEAGIIGLARAFLKTGARSVTMSLWDVDDKETASLMEFFIEELQKPSQFSPAEPWRKAVLRYRKTKSNDPMYWGAFQNFGIPYQLRYTVSHKASR